MKINLFLGLGILISYQICSASLCTQHLERSEFINGIYTRLDYSDFGSSERFRSRLHEKLATWLSDLDSGISARSEIFFMSLHIPQHKVSINNTELMQKLGMESSAGIQKRPFMLEETRATLKATYNENSYSDIPNVFNRGDRKKALLQTALNTLTKDPYFNWLKDNATDNRYEKLTDNLVKDPQGTYSSEAVPTDPIRHLLSSLEISGRGFLPPDLSIMRTVRDLDPEITPAQINLIQATLGLYQASHYIRQEVINHFERRDTIWSSYRAWDLAPSLDVARKNLHSFLKNESAPYVSFMTQGTYENAIHIFASQGVRVQALRRLITAKIGYSEHQTDLQAKQDPITFAELKRELNLDPNLGAEATFEILRLAYTSKSYESFLIKAFSDSNNRNRINGTLLGLTKIIEVAENIDNFQSFSTYIADKIHNKD